MAKLTYMTNLDLFVETLRAEAEAEAQRKSCTHEELESYMDGNMGGFQKFAYVCKACDHELTYDELEAR